MKEETRQRRNYFIEAARESSARVRAVLYIIIVASVISLVTLWNTRPNNTAYRHFRVASAALDLAEGRPVIENRRRMKAEAFREQNRDLLITDDDLAMVVSRLRDEASERRFLAGAPLLNMRLPANDLAVLGGLSFLAMLILLRFVMARHYYNLRRVFDYAAGEGCLGEYVTLLSMYQVLTVPKHPDYSGFGFWKYAPHALIMLPVFVQGFFVANEFLSPPHYKQDIIHSAGSVLLVFVGLVAWSCLSIVRKRSDEWESRRVELESLPEIPEGLAGQWSYRVEKSVDGYLHEGQCEIKAKGKTVELIGERMKIRESASEPIQDVEDQWESIWASLEGGRLRFEYMITLDASEETIKGYCNVPIRRGRPEMKGEYFQLPPTATKPRHGRILFTKIE